jgi:hypothetical protein
MQPHDGPGLTPADADARSFLGVDFNIGRLGISRFDSWAKASPYDRDEGGAYKASEIWSGSPDLDNLLAAVAY